jgi:hypothetical protein
MPDDMSIPSPAVLALSGCGYADFHVVDVNFAIIEFYEVRVLGILGSSPRKL